VPISGLCHISEVDEEGVRVGRGTLAARFSAGDRVRVAVVEFDAESKKLALSMRPSRLSEAEEGQEGAEDEDEEEDDEEEDAGMEDDEEDEEDEDEDLEADDDEEEEDDEDDDDAPAAPAPARFPPAAVWYTGRPRSHRIPKGTAPETSVGYRSLLFPLATAA
jgi:predicted RNA-binding protein with RPS1 domain